MPTLVHLADERIHKKILNGGIKPLHRSGGVYCMPVTPDFYITHQWLRELKSSGAKTFVGIYFHLPSTEMVYAGKYGTRHKYITLGAAIKEIMEMEDPLGYELIINRTIAPSEIKKVKHLPQNIGWRYMPDSHGKKPCNCAYCLKGTIKGKRTKDRLDEEEE